MDELQVIRAFRAHAPAGDVEARRAAREALLARIEAAPRAARWPRLAVVLVALALAGVLAASGLALYDFIAGEPAPGPVADELVEEGTAERIGPFFAGNPQAIADSAHGVAAIQTSAGRAILWATTAAPGPICYIVEFEPVDGARGEPRGKAKCGTRLSSGVPIILDLSRPVVGGEELAIVVGWVHESVGSVFLRAPEGDERELPVSEGFYFAEVPADRVPKDVLPKDFREGKLYEVIARDRAGAELQRFPVAGLPRPLFYNPKVAGPRRTVIDTTDSRGRPMRLSLIPIEGGKTCVEEMTRNGTSTGCGPRLRVEEGIQVHPALVGSMVYVRGSVGPEVAKLELHHQDGYVLELPLVERFVFHDIPRARFEEGKRPILLVARDRDGAEVARMKVGQRAFAPNSAIWSGVDVAP